MCFNMQVGNCLKENFSFRQYLRKANARSVWRRIILSGHTRMVNSTNVKYRRSMWMHQRRKLHYARVGTFESHRVEHTIDVEICRRRRPTSGTPVFATGSPSSMRRFAHRSATCGGRGWGPNEIGHWPGGGGATTSQRCARRTHANYNP